jgi:prepilin-type N-terminal cleavage/methylation domain-containing protein
MRLLHPHLQARRGFTLVEMMTGIAVFVLASGIIISVLRSGLLLYAKNSAVNVAHQQARQALDRLTKDIHSSISIPSLLDVNLAALDGNNVGPAEGVSFQIQAGPTCLVAADAAANQNTIQLTGLGTFVPKVGERLVIPTHQIESDITAVSGNTITLTTNLGVPVTVTNSGGGSNYNIVAYITDLVGYVVVNGELRYYPSVAQNTYTVLARYMTNPKPFGAPYYASQ